MLKYRYLLFFLLVLTGCTIGKNQAGKPFAVDTESPVPAVSSRPAGTQTVPEPSPAHSMLPVFWHTPTPAVQTVPLSA